MCTNDGPDVMTVYPRKLSMYDSLDGMRRILHHHHSCHRRPRGPYYQSVPHILYM
ncbi:hypothetical protein BGY98DRAFT_1015618 [Russula aff. rugulosa BPL654]|nr:hypothetical protein BGY98DRAFT_1037541 [Russula aff. rugulosa BPL654]KAI0269088.1 hypothetical protein BGY98DRAFT_1015618 [Russula aff. rugulosa BPL654]